MKKPFQILNAAIIIIVFSYGIQNAELRHAIKNEVIEASTNNPSLSKESDPLWIDPAIQGLSIIDRRDETLRLKYKPSERTASYTIDKSDLAKTMVRLTGPSGVN